ncbi:DUF1801 domain-containing protein [Jiulongibacter sp. NS-SX5]|uniref:DUF1801 domain-containing protein n=1 Tax=Jiulongibacter sp. NS-SX5 TaxID=3463854 RepID=UPI0040581BAF
MTISADSPEEYIAKAPEERQEALNKIRDIINENIPEGFEHKIDSGMIAWVVPHSFFPDGYHCDPKKPLPFINLASQKNFIALYHMGVYAFPEILEWFQSEYPKHSKRKLDMGKSCLRLKKMDDIPYELIGELARKLTVEEWVNHYQEVMQKK